MAAETFWDLLAGIAAKDSSIAVPEQTVHAAYDIFQPRAQKSATNIFQLKPLADALVRDAGPSRKLFYELHNGCFLNLEQTWEADGIHIHGFINGIDESEVFLYGTESVFRAPVISGEFEFSALEPGEYSLSFWHEEDRYWVSVVYLKEQGDV
ncbi:hypothetical protein SCOR_09055 [Sulfidibacter corallicola]|uniref:Uncharacterized protein n=1 Tax=Sulfidibacter corallicola TaxID=2818388 RepID=A0A8A4TPG3_SULCO|nr:hypothetical protein [Sulfidibacter corallicola]QTD51094.1 hypothetical protein J3U87_01380 [Sulfidibacter corallicola]